MNSFWDSLYDKFKDRRYGALFFFTVLALAGLPIVAIIIDAVLREFNLEDYFLDALPGIGLLALAWGFLTFRRSQARRWKNCSIHPYRVTNCAWPGQNFGMKRNRSTVRRHMFRTPT